MITNTNIDLPKRDLVSPASLAAVRHGMAWETICPCGVTLQGDVYAAYPKAKLDGDATYLELPKKF